MSDRSPKRISPEDVVPLELNARSRELILDHTFAGEDLTARLHLAPGRGQRPFYRFTLDELDELAGFVAAEANHAKVKKLEKELSDLHERITDILNRYTVDPDSD